MNHERFSECGDQHAEEHLVKLTPNKIVWICHGCRSSGSGASVRDGLGWRLRCVIQEAIRIIDFDISQNLSSPARKIAVSKLDIQGMVHVGDGEDNVGSRGSCGGLFHRVSRRGGSRRSSGIGHNEYRKKIEDVSLERF